MKVLLTGSAAHLAIPLLPRLCERPEIAAVRGLDLRPTDFRHAKFSALTGDIRNVNLDHLLDGIDAVIHLAFVVLRGRTRATDMHAINVGASQRLFTAARSRGIRIVHLSSASVYGSGKMLEESAPLNPLPGFLYAQHKAELERWMAQQVPQAVRLRPHIILGQHAQPLLLFLLQLPVYLRLPDPQPLLQCIHEDDVADAIIAALLSDVSGPVNLAAAETYDFRGLSRQQHRRTVGLPLWLARAWLYLAWKLFGAGAEPGWLDGAQHTLTLDCSKAANQLGFRPRHSLQSTLQDSTFSR